MAEVLQEKSPIARKEHRCDYCGGTIHAGERYVNQTLVYDGTVYPWKSHEHCYSLTSYIEYDPDYGISEDDFQSWVNEYVAENHFDKEISAHLKPGKNEDCVFFYPTTGFCKYRPLYRAGLLNPKNDPHYTETIEQYILQGIKYIKEQFIK